MNKVINRPIDRKTEFLLAISGKACYHGEANHMIRNLSTSIIHRDLPEKEGKTVENHFVHKCDNDDAKM
ncbi:MAG: hypothetical protein IJ708_16160 [Clostridia bacterium]|nr:hypothetical protein [Clostridia bacterium]